MKSKLNCDICHKKSASVKRSLWKYFILFGRKILNELSSDSPAVPKIEEEKTEDEVPVSNSPTVPTSIYQTSSGQYSQYTGEWSTHYRVIFSIFCSGAFIYRTVQKSFSHTSLFIPCFQGACIFLKWSWVIVVQAFSLDIGSFFTSFQSSPCSWPFLFLYFFMKPINTDLWAMGNASWSLLKEIKRKLA